MAMARRGRGVGRRAPGGEPDWLTLGQAAKYLGVAQSTIRKWSDQDRVLAFYTPGGHRRYRRADRHLERWIVHHRLSWLDWLFVFLSWIGTDGIVFLVAAAVVALLWRRPWLLVLVVASDLVAELLSYGMRDWIGRRGPPPLS